MNAYPEYVDYLFEQPEQQRRELLEEFGNTNYAAGDVDLIQAIYHLFYQQKVRGDERHRFLRRHDVVTASADAQGIALELRHCDSHAPQRARYDAVVLATGYERRKHRALLDSVQDYLGDFAVQRDYRLRADARLRPAIFIQGGCEETHGLSDTLLSILPIRAQEIIDALLQAAETRETARPRTGTFVSA